MISLAVAEFTNQTTSRNGWVYIHIRIYIRHHPLAQLNTFLLLVLRQCITNKVTSTVVTLIITIIF